MLKESYEYNHKIHKTLSKKDFLDMLKSNLFSNVIFINQSLQNKNFKGYISFGSKWELGDTKRKKPLNFYAATKKCDEIMSYSYAQIYKLKIVCLRFFTVYGPYGRPDMTPYSFIKNHYKGKSIKVFNQGKHQRDFTYIDDTVNTLYDLLSSYISRKNVILSSKN